MEKYLEGGEITTDKIKWAIIDEVMEEQDSLWVTDEEGETHEVYFDQVNSYFEPKGDNYVQ